MHQRHVRIPFLWNLDVPPTKEQLFNKVDDTHRMESMTAAMRDQAGNLMNKWKPGLGFCFQ